MLIVGNEPEDREMKAMNSKLTVEDVKHALDFDPSVGIFVWKNPQSNAVKVGDPAGVIAANGRRYINVGGEKHMGHRLAWFYIHGEWPDGDVKQKNGNYDDLREGNLVLQSRQQTALNRRVNASSKSGHAGITWSEGRQKWQVHITQDYKQVGLGYFSDLDVAVAVRREALDTVATVDPAEREKAARSIANRRRQRVAYNRLVALGKPLGWASLDDFCRDIGDIPQTNTAIVAIDESIPIGPGNYRWSLPLEKKYDFQTREGRIAHGLDHRAANRDSYRDRDLRRKLGVSLKGKEAILADQGGVCAICERSERAERDGKPIAMAMDHDHATGKLRGVLCGNCNKAIGKFEDNPDFLRNAIVYLAKHAAPRPFVCDDVTRDWLHVATLGFEA
jgi:Recombination endonuclease VII